jgi:predicted Mrr-cat superfamily restriction endonuclease
MGDMTTLPNDREAFKERLWQTHPDYHSTRGASAAAGMLYRFVFGIKRGDTIVCPTPGGGDPVHIGEVIGDYRYEPNAPDGHVHLRQVRWLVEVPRGDLSEAAKGNLRVTRSLHPIHRRAAEFLKYL